MARLARLLAPCAALLLLAETCLGQWIEDARLRRETEAKQRTPARRLSVDLDLPPAQRWEFLRHDPTFAHYKEDLNSYLGEFLSPTVISLVSKIVQGMDRSFYPDYAAEMRGLAIALNMTLGEIVLVNLIYQIENAFGTDCKLLNSTGPCPSRKTGPGLCSGLVANGQNDADPVWQGRNQDWNFPPALLRYILQVEYKKGGVTVFTGVQAAGMAGILHGMRKGSTSVQLNARDHGGSPFVNILEELVRGAKTPTHVMRKALEETTNFTAAKNILVSERLANPAYYVMGGTEHSQGAIVARDRESVADVWQLNETSSKDKAGINPQPGWFRFQTNYDHWEKAPSYDDRRTPGVAYTKDFCGGGVDEKCVWKVMTTWPVLNPHTDVTSVMCASTGFIETVVWMPSAAVAGLVPRVSNIVVV